MNSLLKKETGFFRDKHSKFVESLTRNELNTFASLSNDESRFEFVYQHPGAQDCIIQVSSCEKSESTATLLKERGNKSFQIGDYRNALLLYNKAILQCPIKPGNNENLAILRANNSAALYHLGDYKVALKDIEYASQLGYPKDLLYKLKDRKARCLLALKQNKSALQALRETLQALDDAKLKTDKRQKWQRDVQIMMAMISKTNAINVLEETNKDNGQKLLEEHNKIYQAASNAVKIKESQNEGRYAEARKKIKTGEIIVSEPAHCAVLLEEHVLTHCFQCFKRLISFEPCPTCCQVAFCSEVCGKLALETHHKYECGILKTLWASGASITCFMALRILTQKPLAFFTRLKDKQINQEETYLWSDYRTVYNLVTHETKRSVTDLLHRAHMAVFLFNCLNETGYFKEEGIHEAEKNKKLIGGLLLHHLQLLQFNAHEVSELQIKDGNINQSKSIFLGGAVYPTLALFNHSCNPSLTRYFQGTKVVARAIHNINPGELIAENYGPIFTQTPKKERQQTLQTQYWFECFCKACSENWPLIDKMDSNILRFQCENKDKCSNVICVPTNTMDFMVKCNKCAQHINILKGLKVLQDTDSLYRIAKSFMDEGNIQQALRKFMELLQILDETLAPPFTDYHFCQQAIRTCFLTLGNNYNEM